MKIQLEGEISLMDFLQQSMIKMAENQKDSVTLDAHWGDLGTVKFELKLLSAEDN